ncbi:amidase domain-containing protein [Psychroserpens sp. MEBiC05023]
MSEKKNIDKLFKEQLKNFEVAPSDTVWENIERELHKDKRKRRVLPIWWKIAGVAALLALLFTVGKAVFNANESANPDQEVVDTKSQKESTKDTNDGISNTTNPSGLDHNNTNVTSNEDSSEDTSDNATESISGQQLTTSDKTANNTTITNSEDAKSSLEKEQKKSSIIKNKSQQRNAIANTSIDDPKQIKAHTKLSSSEKNAVATTTSQDIKSNQEIKENDIIKKPQSEIDKLINASKQNNPTVVSSSNASEKEQNSVSIDSSKATEIIKENNAIEKAIAQAQKDKDSVIDAEKPLKRWSVAPNVAPVYFNTLGKGSSLDNQFVNNTKEGDVNMSYGIQGAYAINEKLKIRAGINKVDLGYSTNNILVFDGADPIPSARQIQNVQLNDTHNSSAYVSANNVSFATGPAVLFTKEQGAIDQQLGFIEVPIELEYNIVDNKFGLNLIGGFSTLFLNTNEIYSVQNNGERALLGEATNINDMSYSANFGIGVNYNISEKLRFNLEPTFKYQINTFSDTAGDFQPFFIGVYTGLSFKF